MPLYGRLSYEAYSGAMTNAEEEARERYDLMLDGKQEVADNQLYLLFAGALEDVGIAYNAASLMRMVSVEGLFAAPKHTDAGRVREAIARLTETPSFEAWQEGGAMTFTEEQKKALAQPLERSRVKVTQGNSYIEGWDAIATANRIFDFDGWNYEVVSIGEIGTFNRKDKDIALYEAKVRVTVDGVERVDIGTGLTAGDSPEAHETAVKGAVTDGLKRALRTFGDQFGNVLYDKDSELHKPAPRQPQRQQRVASPGTKPTVDLGICPKHNEPWVTGRGGKVGHVQEGTGPCLREEVEATA